MSVKTAATRMALEKGRKEVVSYVKKNCTIRGEKFMVPRDGKEEVMVYLYRPQGSGGAKKLPVIFNIHGGAWVGNDALVLDTQSRQMADRLMAAVVNINYTKVDIQPFPYPQQEIFDTVCYFADHAERFGMDSENMVLRGYSAGGHLAACAAQMLQKAGRPLAGQILCYPFLDFAFEEEKGKLMFGDMQKQIEELFFSKLPKEDLLCSPGAAPAESLAGLAPALLITCGEDPLRFQAQAYQKKLESAGVPVKLWHYGEARHGFLEVNYPETKEYEAKNPAQEALARQCENDIASEWERRYGGRKIEKEDR